MLNIHTEVLLGEKMYPHAVMVVLVQALVRPLEGSLIQKHTGLFSLIRGELESQGLVQSLR